MRSLILAVLCAGGLAGCADPVADGKALFADRAIAESASNQTTCALCHDAQPTSRRRSGYPLAGVTARPSWWNGQVLDLFAAVDVCVTTFMGGRGLERDGRDARDLYEYLASLQAPEPRWIEALPVTVPKTVSAATLAALPAGDAGRGAAVYTDACADCHGIAGTGVGRLTSTTSVVPNELLVNDMFPDLATKRVVVVEKIRHGKLFGIGGLMPPFAEERLDDQGVADLMAYFATLGL